MRLHSLTVRGFKSFGESVYLEFLPGVNAVIGPNGSGKSNVIEAIRWVSHTARTRELRAKTASELIFHGSKGQKRAEAAEVELVLRDAKNVTIRRRMLLSGDQALLLDGKTTRVRDLHDHLRGTGLGPGGLAVISQGEVSAVVSADPETMLGYLIEAAGLSKASNRKSQTIEKLQSAREHLEQVETLANELRTRVARLETAASSSRESSKLTQEIQDLESALLRHKRRNLLKEISDLGLALATLTDEIIKSEEGIGHLSGQIELLRLKREELQTELTARSLGAERLMNELKSKREQVKRSESVLSASANERSNLEVEAIKLASLPSVSAPPELPSADVQEIGNQLLALRQEIGELVSLETSKNQALRQARLERERLERELAERRAQAAALAAQKNSIEEEIDDAKTSLEILERDRVSFKIALDEALIEFEIAKKQLNQRENELIDNSFESKKSRLSELLTSQTILKREAERLESLISSYNRFGEGPRKALTSGEEGILGAVADLIQVPSDLEVAIQAALGRRLEQVVVETGAVAEKVINYLKKIGGRATFLPLDLLQIRSRRVSPVLHELGVLGIAADLIEAEIDQLKEYLLGDTAIVQDVNLAVRLARRYAQRPRLVTLDGEVLEPGGALSGGRGRDTTSGHLADSRRLAEIENELGSIEGEANRLRRVIDERQALEKTNRQLIDEAREKLTKTSTDLQEKRTALTRLEAQISIEEKRFNNLQNRQNNFGQTELNEIILPDLSEFETILEEIAIKLSDLRQKETQLAGTHSEAKSQIAIYLERKRAFEEARELQAQAESRRQAINIRLHELNDLETQNKSNLEVLYPEIEKLESELEQFELKPWQKSLEENEIEQQNLNKELLEINNQIRTKRDQLENRRLKQAKLETMLESLDFVIDAEDPPGSPAVWNVRLDAAKTRLERLGPVNPLAEAEFEIEFARLAELEQGIEDASLAAKELENVLDELDREVTSQLVGAIERVKKSFSSYTEELLGGFGELKVLQNENGVSGLTLSIEPKGKKTRSLHLLSTGERTMAALAFLFALSTATEDAQGLPISVLDEVDAALDEANIRRFTSFLKVLAEKGTQFVLITHQKATMEIADALWGVTTDKTGTSKVFSIKKENLVAG